MQMKHNYLVVVVELLFEQYFTFSHWWLQKNSRNKQNFCKKMLQNIFLVNSIVSVLLCPFLTFFL